jgi:hypothetical protein
LTPIESKVREPDILRRKREIEAAAAEPDIKVVEIVKTVYVDRPVEDAPVP